MEQPPASSGSKLPEGLMLPDIVPSIPMPESSPAAHQGNPSATKDSNDSHFGIVSADLTAMIDQHTKMISVERLRAEEDKNDADYDTDTDTDDTEAGGSPVPQPLPNAATEPARSFFPQPALQTGFAARPEINHAESRGFELHRIHTVAHELRDGDTLVFVDFPDCPSGAKYVDCTGTAFRSVQLRMWSHTLLETGSSKFADMLKPSYQFRIQRRRKLVNKLPEGVRFVLDLTPPTEGDELVFQMTELSLTPGIMQWWRASTKHLVDAWVVLGHDDRCSCWKTQSKPTIPALPPLDPPVSPKGKAKVKDSDDEDDALSKLAKPKPTKKESEERLSWTEQRDLDLAIRNSVVEMKVPSRENPMGGGGSSSQQTGAGTDGKAEAPANGATQSTTKKEAGDVNLDETPTHFDIPDYCQVRHCTNIIRLLMIIAGKDVMLDSAVRVWTLVGIAKIWECPQVLRDHVFGWLMSSNNMKFLEVLPEEALQLGYELQLPNITRLAFSILVTEAALEEAATDRAPTQASRLAPVTIFGRRRHDPGDDLNNLIQHASRALVARAHEQMEAITSQMLFDKIGIPGWLKLVRLDLLLSTTDPQVQAEQGPWRAPTLYKLRRLLQALAYQYPLSFHEAADCTAGLENATTLIDDDRATYVAAKDFTKFPSIYEKLNQVQRMLCPYLWRFLDEKWATVSYFATSRYPDTEGVRMSKLQREFLIAASKLFETAPKLRAAAGWGPEWDMHDFLGAISGDRKLKEFRLEVWQAWLNHDLEPQPSMTRHLMLNLQQSELKYLPLWAGGLNDGTGGVFEEQLPPATFGPNGPGPAYHTGHTLPSDRSSSDTASTAGSITREIRGLGLGGSSTASTRTLGVPGSLDAQDSVSTAYNPRAVLADNVSIKSESFTDSSSSEYENARFAHPAEHQDMAVAVEMMVEDGDRFDGLVEVEFGEDIDSMLDDDLVSDADTETVYPEDDGDESRVDAGGDTEMVTVDDSATEGRSQGQGQAAPSEDENGSDEDSDIVLV